MGLFSKKKKRFGEIAVQKGYITRKILDEALADQRRFKEKGALHKTISTILMDKGTLEIDEVNIILKEQDKSPFWAYVGSFLSLRRKI